MNNTVGDAPATEAGGETVLRLVLGAAITRLADRQREVMSLRYLADLDEIEVSEALGMSVRSVKKHEARGKAALRSELGPIPELNLVLESRPALR
jgi:RNA polymerase sigma factor (sigma-70 family)